MKKLLFILFSMMCIYSNATLYEYNTYTVGYYTGDPSYYPYKYGQTFTVGTVGTNESFVIDSISKPGTVLNFTTHNYHAQIYATSGGLPTGSALSNSTLTKVSSFVMSPCALNPSTTYAIVIYTNEVYSGIMGYELSPNPAASTYSGGSYIYYNGSTWNAYSTYDLQFRIYGKHAPIITSQPSAVSSCDGTSSTFSIIVDTDSPHYQWRKGGSNISGAINSSYTILNTHGSDSANYDCVVTESLLGTTTTSNSAKLTVLYPPSITVQPASQDICSGHNVTFSVTTTGNTSLYWWYKDGAPLSNGTPNSYTITGATTSNIGSYTVMATGNCGYAMSNNALLTVDTYPVITHPSTGTTITKNEGQSVSLGITASSYYNNMTYNWYKTGVLVYQSNDSTISMESLKTSDAGYYECIVHNTCGSPSSPQYHLIVNALPSTSYGYKALLNRKNKYIFLNKKKRTYLK